MSKFPKHLINYSLLVATLTLIAFSSSSIAANCGEILLNFNSPLHFSNGSTTVRTATADFNNDGDLDIAATAHDASFVGIFLGDGTGDFSEPTILPAGGFSVPVATGDFNNDGNHDVAIGSWDGVVWIYLGDGNGGFGPAAQYNDGSGEAYEIAVADFDQDGNLDLAIGLSGLSILLGDGSGAFAHFATHDLGGIALVKNSDFNNDGRADLIAFNHYGTNPWILLGDGTGGFSVSISSIENPSYGIGDFNEDGNMDVVTPNNDNASISLYLGDGLGGFGPGESFYSIHSGNPQAADFDGDGDLDIAATGGFENKMAIILGNGAGAFGAPTTFDTGNGPGVPMPGDFNNDEKADIVTANYFGGDITVMLNSSSPMPFVNPLFDTTQAYRRGSTIPIKLELTDCNGSNVSSDSTVVTAYDLRLVGGTTSSPVVDSGNANPDYNFRYIGADGGSYMFNLSTRGLGSGTYRLYFHVGNNNATNYEVQFEIR